jgi:hypothetical protein
MQVYSEGVCDQECLDSMTFYPALCFAALSKEIHADYEYVPVSKFEAN